MCQAPDIFVLSFLNPLNSEISRHDSTKTRDLHHEIGWECNTLLTIQPVNSSGSPPWRHVGNKNLLLMLEWTGGISSSYDGWRGREEGGGQSVAAVCQANNRRINIRHARSQQSTVQSSHQVLPTPRPTLLTYFYTLLTEIWRFIAINLHCLLLTQPVCSFAKTC